MGRKKSTTAKSAAELAQLPGRQLTSLWAGYGTIEEATKVASDGEDELGVIIKRVRPPKDSGVSHNRKLKSYEVEAYFYAELAAVVLAKGGACNIPQPLLVQSDLSSSGGSLTLVLEDLRPRFPDPAGSMDLPHAEAALTWLAAFHAIFWEQPTPEGVWSSGCYWHLETRQEEWKAIGREWQALKQAAAAIDDRLQGPGPHRTLCHGDFKGANIVFSRGQSGPLECAAYDFQYLGGGYGMKDVVYLLGSSVQGRVVEAGEAALLAHYHRELTSRLPAPAAEAYTAEVMAEHWKYALLDYMRFMAGWGCWGNASWVARRAKEYLAELGL